MFNKYKRKKYGEQGRGNLGWLWGTKKIFYVVFKCYIDGDEIFLCITEGNVPVHKARDIKRPNLFFFYYGWFSFILILIFLLQGWVQRINRIKGKIVQNKDSIAFTCEKPYRDSTLYFYRKNKMQT